MSPQELPLPPEHYARLRAWVIQQLRKGSEPPPMGMTPENWRWVRDRTSQLLASARVSLPPETLERLVDEVGDEVVGYGPIGPLVRDPSITEIMVNGPHQVYVERGGKIVEVDVRFRDEHHVMEVIERILRPLGRKVDRAWPIADARLPDGSRVNVIIPPCALNGPTVTIRKFPARQLIADSRIFGVGKASFGSLPNSKKALLLMMKLLQPGGQRLADLLHLGMAPQLLLGEHQFPVHPNLKDAPAGGDERPRSYLAFEFLEQLLGQPDRSGEIPSDRAVFDFHTQHANLHAGFRFYRLGRGLRPPTQPGQNLPSASIGLWTNGR